MSLYTASLNSGSNGNCYYISNGKDAILVDVGLSCREIESRMKKMGLAPNNIRAVFISHEHTDHIKGTSVLSGKYNIPVYISPKTLKNSQYRLKPSNIRELQAGVPVDIHGMMVTGFTKVHDAADPHSFIVEGNGVTIGVFTDLGIACDNLAQHLRLCHAAYLESNYDADMLENGKYSIHLKNRIRGGRGHLSNAEALELFKAHKPAHMSHLFLAHLSKDNNNPELALNLFKEHADGVNVIVASRYGPGDVYHITGNPITTADSVVKKMKQAVLF